MEFIEKIYNNNYLKDEDINERTVRARAIIINSDNEVLMCYSNGLSHYEFPGGHLEPGETLLDCLKREVREETGIKIETEEIEPFFSIKYYCKNYHATSKNRLVEIYYFIVSTAQKYDRSQIELSTNEQKQNYVCYYIPINNLKKLLMVNKHTTKEKNSALDDTLLVWETYIEKMKEREKYMRGCDLSKKQLTKKLKSYYDGENEKTLVDALIVVIKEF